MTIKRVQRKIERTPEEHARIVALHAKYERERPGPDELAASGEYEGPVQAGAYWEVRRVMAELKAERERQGLTLAQLADRSGLDKGAISKLETGRQVNPTVDTLSRIATGLGLTFATTLRRDDPKDKRRRSGEDSAKRKAAETGQGKPVEPRAGHAAEVPSADTARNLLSSLQELQAWLASQVAERVEKPKLRRVKAARR
jgi:transcriptional regulator with XRE-family HTH domain